MEHFYSLMLLFVTLILFKNTAPSCSIKRKFLIFFLIFSYDLIQVIHSWLKKCIDDACLSQDIACVGHLFSISSSLATLIFIILSRSDFSTVQLLLFLSCKQQAICGKPFKIIQLLEEDNFIIVKSRF